MSASLLKQAAIEDTRSLAKLMVEMAGTLEKLADLFEGSELPSMRASKVTDALTEKAERRLRQLIVESTIQKDLPDDTELYFIRGLHSQLKFFQWACQTAEEEKLASPANDV